MQRGHFRANKIQAVAPSADAVTGFIDSRLPFALPSQRHLLNRVPGMELYINGGEDVSRIENAESLFANIEFAHHALTGMGKNMAVIKPTSKRATSRALAVVRRRFARVLARHGCRSTDHFAGFQITGRYNATELAQLIRALPDGSTEFMCHPGICGDELRGARTRLKESRERELEALTSPEVRAALAESGVELVSYRSL